jgi:hypothetical protein
MNTVTMYNALVVGKIGSGKTTLVSLMTNKILESGVFVLDPNFEMTNIRCCANENISFIDTLGLTGKIASDTSYLTDLRDILFHEHYSISLIIVCMDTRRLKVADINIFESIQTVFRSRHGYRYHIHFKDMNILPRDLLVDIGKYISVYSWSFYKAENDKESKEIGNDTYHITSGNGEFLRSEIYRNIVS